MAKTELRARAVAIGRATDWLGTGFERFKQRPAAWIVAFVVFFLINLALNLIPGVGQLIVGLLGYVWLAGFMIGCHAQVGGAPFEVKHLFAGFSRHSGRLLLLGIVMAIATVIIVAITIGPLFVALSKVDPRDAQAIAQAMPPASILLLRLLICLLFIIPLSMAAWFAPALIALNDALVFEAMKKSFAGCLKNVMPFLLYGIVAVVLAILATIPFGLGWLVLGPVWLASIHASYEDIFVPDPLTTRQSQEAPPTANLTRSMSELASAPPPQWREDEPPHSREM